MSGKSVKRSRKPSGNKTEIVHKSPKTGEFWIHDIAAKATYYPTSLEKFKITCARLLHEKRELKTSHQL
jgi:hypothetical protein